MDLLRRNIEKAEGLMKEGGDWDRRNRLKVGRLTCLHACIDVCHASPSCMPPHSSYQVYKGLYKLAIRSFSEAAELFLETVSTFTTTELLSYGEFIGLTVLVALVSLDRPTLKEKVRAGRQSWSRAMY